MGTRPQPRWDGRRFRAQVGGKRYSLGTDLARAHERFAVIYRQVMGKNISLPPPTVVAMLARTWEAEEEATKWQHQMLIPWVRWGGRLRLADVADDHLVRFHAWCKKQEHPGTGTRWTPESVKHFMAAAVRVLKWGHGRSLVPVIPRRPKLQATGYRPRDLSIDQVGRLLDNLEGHPAGPLVKFLLLTGARPTEGRLLTWSQVRLDQQVALIAEHKTKDKTGAVRSVALSAEAVELLQGLPGTRKGYVFLNQKGRPYTRGGLRSVLYRRGFTPYSLRHTWAQHYVDAGAPLEVVGKGLGHKTDRVTRRYAAIRDKRVHQMLADQSSPVLLSLAAHQRGDGDGARQRRGKKKPKKR